MRKSFLIVILLLIVGTLMSSSAYAASTSYSWYCKHEKNHVQPTIAEELRFVESLGGYCLDRKNTDPNADDKVIYLTFDAGYENGNIEKTLDVLREKNVPAAFFILEHLITANTDLVKRMSEEGHTVCNHTASHKDMSRLDSDAFLSELNRLEAVYEQKTGKKMAKYYRPPEGKFSRENLTFANENGYKTIFWSFAYPDWNNNNQMPLEKAKQIILENAHNGEIMLLHPTSQTNAAILGEVIDELRAQGYRFGTLDELTGDRGA